MDSVKWKLKAYLEHHKLSAYALTKATDLSPNTVYTIARGDTNQVRLETLAGLLGGLRKLTGREVSLEDVLEHEYRPESEENALEREHALWESALLEASGSPVHEPYDWGDVSPETLGEPLRYIEGRGWVEGDERG